VGTDFFDIPTFGESD